MHLGLHIGEVAHDFQVQVSRYVTDELGITNSYDTWHGRSHIYAQYTCMCTCTCKCKHNVTQMKGKVAFQRNVEWYMYMYLYFDLFTCTCTCIYLYLYMYVRHKECGERAEEDNSRSQQVGRSELVPAVD